MDEHLGLAPVELTEHGREDGIAEELAVIARHQADAVELQGVERVFDFLEAALSIRQRQRSEHAEAAGMVLIIWRRIRYICGRGSGRRHCRRRTTRLAGHRHDGSGDAGLVHLVQGELGCPTGVCSRRQGSGSLSSRSRLGADIFRRINVMMGVNDARSATLPKARPPIAAVADNIASTSRREVL